MTATMEHETVTDTTTPVSITVDVGQVRDALAWALGSSTARAGDMGTVVNVSINGRAKHWHGTTAQLTTSGLTFECTDRYRATWATLFTEQGDYDTPASVAVPHKALSAAVKALPKVGTVTVTVTPGAHVVLTTDHGTTRVDTDIYYGARFPKLWSLIPDTFTPSSTDMYVAYDPAFLMALGKAGKAVGRSYVRLMLQAKDKATLIAATSNHDDMVHMSGLLMPVRENR